MKGGREERGGKKGGGREERERENYTITHKNKYAESAPWILVPFTVRRS